MWQLWERNITSTVNTPHSLLHIFHGLSCAFYNPLHPLYSLLDRNTTKQLSDKRISPRYFLNISMLLSLHRRILYHVSDRLLQIGNLGCNLGTLEKALPPSILGKSVTFSD